MNFKKILALMLALIMTFTLAGCGNTDDEQIPAVSGDQQVGDIPENQEETPAETETYPLLQIDGKEVDTDGLIMMTVNGLEIPFDEWRYMYMYCDVNGFSAGSVEYWEAHPEQFENLLAMTEQQVLKPLGTAPCRSQRRYPYRRGLRPHRGELAGAAGHVRLRRGV